MTTAPGSGLPFSCVTRTCRSAAGAAPHTLKHSSRPQRQPPAVPGICPKLPFALCIGIIHVRGFSLLWPNARLRLCTPDYHPARIFEWFDMDSFRNRLLALIIGLVVATQSVTLVAVLANTDHEVKVRADATAALRLPGGPAVHAASAPIS